MHLLVIRGTETAHDSLSVAACVCRGYGQLMLRGQVLRRVHHEIVVVPVESMAPLPALFRRLNHRRQLNHLLPVIIAHGNRIAHLACRSVVL